MTNTQTKPEYGNPDSIDIFDDYERLKAARKQNGKKVKEKIFSYSKSLTDSAQRLLSDINIISSNYSYEAVIIAELSDSIVVAVPSSKDSIYVDKSKKEVPFFEGKKIGDTIRILVVSTKDNLFKGSVAGLYEKQLQEELRNPASNDAYDATIKSWTPAGYNINLQYHDVTLPAFMPNTLAGVNKLHDPQSIVGQNMKVMIESYSNDKGTYIVSRRKYLQTLIYKETKRLKYDTVYTGHVTGSTPFGVFIEFNDCLTGMIHKTNILPEWQDKMDQIKPGMGIEFYIKEVIKDKIILTQIIKESLWDNIKGGQKITGKVKDVKAFGVLVQLDEETIGLVHISEVEKSGKKFSQNESIDVKVLSVDRMSRKIFLTPSN